MIKPETAILHGNLNTNQDKKNFGFIKKRATQEESNSQVNTFGQNINLADNPSPNDSNIKSNNLFHLLSNNTNQSISTKKDVTEKSGFSFIKSTNKNMSGSNCNTNSNPSASDSKSSLNYNLDILNEIYSKSTKQHENQSPSDNCLNNPNLIADKLSNIGFNNNYIPNSNLNSNINNMYYVNGSNTYNNNEMQNLGNQVNNHRKSNYVAPNFDVIFAQNSGINSNINSLSSDQAEKTDQKPIKQTNEEIDFLSELNLGKIKK